MTFPTGETTIYFYAPFFWSNGGDFVDKSGLKVDGIFNSKENLETVNYFKQILANGYMSKVAISNLFESGRAAFKIDGAWEVNSVYTSYEQLNLGVAPYVVSDNWMVVVIHQQDLGHLQLLKRQKILKGQQNWLSG